MCENQNYIIKHDVRKSDKNSKFNNLRYKILPASNKCSQTRTHIWV